MVRPKRRTTGTQTVQLNTDEGLEEEVLEEEAEHRQVVAEEEVVEVANVYDSARVCMYKFAL